VAIDPRDAGARQCRVQRFLDALRAMADGGDVGAATAGTLHRHALLVPAVMAAHAALGAMQHQVRAAARAGRMPLAGAAEEHRRETAPVEEEERLLAALEART